MSSTPHNYRSSDFLPQDLQSGQPLRTRGSNSSLHQEFMNPGATGSSYPAQPAGSRPGTSTSMGGHGCGVQPFFAFQHCKNNVHAPVLMATFKIYTPSDLNIPGAHTLINVSIPLIEDGYSPTRTPSPLPAELRMAAPAAGSRVSSPDYPLDESSPERELHDEPTSPVPTDRDLATKKMRYKFYSRTKGSKLPPISSRRISRSMSPSRRPSSSSAPCPPSSPAPCPPSSPAPCPPSSPAPFPPSSPALGASQRTFPGLPVCTIEGRQNDFASQDQFLMHKETPAAPVHEFFCARAGCSGNGARRARDLPGFVSLDTLGSHLNRRPDDDPCVVACKEKGWIRGARRSIMCLTVDPYDPSTYSHLIPKGLLTFPLAE